MEEAAIQTIKRPRQSTTSVRSVLIMFISPIPAYSQQQSSRIPLLPYITERNQQQRQSQRSISPTYKRADESEENDFLDEIIPEITMPHLPSYKTDMETAQRTWKNRRYDLVKDPNVIIQQNSKWHRKLETMKPFTFRDWRKFLSDVGFSFEQIKHRTICQRNTSLKALTIRMCNREKRLEQRGRWQMRQSWKQKLKRNKAVVVAAVVTEAEAVTAKARKYKKIGQEKETRQFCEPMETRTGWKMMNATERQRKRDRSMKPIIEEEKKKLKVMLSGQYKEYPIKAGPVFFYSPKNYRPTLISRPKLLNLLEEQWNQFDGDVSEGVVLFCL
ncbi:MAG: hypothetical protein EZS28_008625 [Streblomastix strix]|uniref:Uncharacterized protein n=1 Tax=Streblomastix strix TaxID=222440 RepID=A0A5J4WLL4_9EUKA|nr:MAG: hypothetical protein EZS28_008625 [Streblomastix strix]